MSEGTKHVVEIQNVVAVASLGQKMDLIAIMKVFMNVDYRPRRARALMQMFPQ